MTDETIKRDTVEYNDPTPFDNSELQSISEISKALRHKMNGKDVREPIAQQGEALVKLIQETGGNQSAEVASARGKFDLLGMREDAQDNAITKTMTDLVGKFDSDQAEAYLKSITAVPETFANLAAIKAKYPSGKNGLMIAADNGHKYIWANNVWTDAGVYQSVGKDSVITDSIVDKAVTAAKTNFVDADVNIANPANILNGYRYAISNGIVSKISDSAYKCILIPVASDYWYSMNIDTYSANFSHAVDESMKQVSLLWNLERNSASIFKTTPTTRFIAISVASTVDLAKLVVMQKRENILNYTTNEWPYNQPKNIKIPGLQVGGSPVEELKNPSYKDVISKKSEILKASEFTVCSGGTITDNTWSGSGQYQGMYTRFFESNFEETMIDIDVTISSLTSVDVMLRYRNSANTSKYISLFEATSSFKTTLSFDASNLAIYNDAKDFAILVRNTGTNEGSFTIDNLLVYTDEMRKTSFYADNLKEVLLNIDEKFNEIKPIEETILTSPSGKNFKLMISNDGNLTVKSLSFHKINISGNSLVNGINQGSHGARNFGMCASDSKHDFNYLVQQAILAKNTDATFTQTQISGIEMATNQDEYETYKDSIANSYTADTDLIILQIGDNTTQYIKTFENTFPQFLTWLKGKCPIADIVVVGTWFSKAVGYPVVKKCTSDAGLNFVDISALNITENQSTSGAIIAYDDGTTVTASESWIRHPGNVGMQKIADKIIKSVGI